MISAPTLSPSPDQFVQRLLRTTQIERRRTLIQGYHPGAEELRAAVLRLCDEAQRVLGVDPTRMERICCDALALACQADDHFAAAMARMGLADSLRVRGRNEEALCEYDRAQVSFVRFERPVEAARTRVGWSDAAAKLGMVSEALAALMTARRVFIAHNEHFRVAVATFNIAGAHLQAGRFRVAARWYGAALALFHGFGEQGRLGVARCLQNRALARAGLGRHRASLADLEAARSIWEETGETAGIARMVAHQGSNYRALGRYSAALQAFERARAMNLHLAITAQEASLGCETADCYLALNRPDDALAVLTETAAELANGGSVQDALGVATRQVAAHLLRGEEQAALAVLHEAERRFQSGAMQHRAWLAAQRAAVLAREGEFRETLTSAQRARALANAAGMRRVVADARISESAAHLGLGNLREAEASAVAARRIAREMDAAPLLHRVLELLGRIAEARGATRLAIRRYEAACLQLEREQRGVIFEFRAGFAAGRGLAYERLVSLYARAGNARAALAVAERARSRALTEAIAGGLELRSRGNADVRALARELRAAREDYAAGFAARDELGAPPPDAQRLEARITTLVHALQIAGASREAGANGAPPDDRLPDFSPGQGMLVYFISGADIVRFLIDQSGVAVAVLEDAAPAAERWIRALRLNLHAAANAQPEALTGSTAQAQALLGRLWQLLLGDLPGLDGLSSLVIAPHGILHSLPFQALHDGHRYLVERMTVSYAPSVALARVCQERRPPARGGALVLGHSGGGSLPHAVAEAESVAALLGAPVYREAQATRALVEREGRRAALIHIAAHGQFRPDAPLFSFVQLAGGSLTTEDVFNLDLRGALVTLSACETGRAISGGGDELAGLTRAFLYAGASGLLVSQWRVDDAATAALMTAFYRALRAGVGRASALREAQRAALTAGAAHPFSWAGFQLLGDDQPLPVRGQRGVPRQ